MLSPREKHYLLKLGIQAEIDRITAKGAEEDRRCYNSGVPEKAIIAAKRRVARKRRLRDELEKLDKRRRQRARTTR